jgi:hypothetical protein
MLHNEITDSDLRGIADPQLETEFCEQALEPAGVAHGLHPHAHADSSLLQVSVELLCFSLAVIQSPFAALPPFLLQERDLLEARVITTPIMIMFGSFLPSLGR